MTLPFFRRRRSKENARFRTSRLPVNVPLSRKEIRMRRRARTIRLVRGSVLGIAAVAMLLYGRSVWKGAFRGNPGFAVGQFEYHTNGGITAPQAAAAAGLRPDMNLMELDIGAIRSRLMALPRVKSVTVERRLPDRLAIEIMERLPVAWITSVVAGRAHNIEQRNRLFVDRDGVAFKCDEVLREYMTLPVINAADEPVITLGRSVESAAVKAALALLEEFRTREWSAPCTVVHIAIPNSWTLVAEMESGAVFTLNPENLDQQLKRLEFILGTTRAANRSVAAVNLQMRRNVPVRLGGQFATATAGAAAPAAAEPASDRVSFPRAGGRPRPRVPAAPDRSSKPAPASRQEQDIQSILRGT